VEVSVKIKEIFQEIRNVLIPFSVEIKKGGNDKPKIIALIDNIN
jgi:hypothetical protein